MIQQGAISQLPLWFGLHDSATKVVISQATLNALQAVEKVSNEIRKSVRQLISIQAMYKQELFHETHQESPTAIRESINKNQQEIVSKQEGEEENTNILSESWHEKQSSQFDKKSEPFPTWKPEKTLQQQQQVQSA